MPLKPELACMYDWVWFSSGHRATNWYSCSDCPFSLQGKFGVCSRVAKACSDILQRFREDEV